MGSDVLIQPGRGVGNTTRQMQAAPKDGVYVWCNHHLDYPRRLARELGREDLHIVSPQWLSDRRWQGLRFSGYEADHACRLSEEDWAILDLLRRLRVK